MPQIVTNNAQITHRQSLNLAWTIIGVIAVLLIGPIASGAMVSGQWYTITNVTSGMCVTDTNSSTSNNTPLEQSPCVKGQLNQQWKFTATSGGYYTINNRNAPRSCLG